MNRLWLVTMLLITGCSAAPWSWQDLGTPPRGSADADLAACRSYAAAQYRPGVPAGDPYLHDQPAAARPADPVAAAFPGTGTWHPDREPFPAANQNQLPVHGVVVPYTGYPGSLDYHPDYLDSLVEKCMADRGWVFRPPEPAPPK